MAREFLVLFGGKVDPSLRSASAAAAGQVAAVGTAAEDAGRRAGGIGKIAGAGMVAVGTLAADAARGLFGMAKSAAGMGYEVAAGNEQAKISFTTMLGSAEKANAFLGKMQKFAAETPFEFPELQKAAGSLISIGVQTDKVLPIMRTLGDVTSGMGTGSEGIKRATIALQQMNAAGRITAEDLNQLRDAGIPVYDLLAAATGRSKEAVADMAQKGKLGRKELEQLMKALESGKGLERFRGLMDKQSQSLTGLASTLKDTFGMGMAQAIEPAVPLLKEGLGGAIAAVGAAVPYAQRGVQGLVDLFNRHRPEIEAFAKGVKTTWLDAIGVFKGDKSADDVGGWAAKIADGARKASLAIGGLWAVFAKADYDPNYWDELGIEEDSPLIAGLFAARNAFVGLWESVKAADFSQVKTMLAGVAESLGGMVTKLMNADFSPVIDGAKRLGESVGPALSKLGDAGGDDKLQSAIDGTARALGFLADNADKIVAGLPFLVGGFLALKGAQELNALLGRESAAGALMQVVANTSLAASNLALSGAIRAQTAAKGTDTAATTGNTVAENMADATRKRSIIGMVAHRAATLASSAASKAAAAGQWLLNAAMSANPIGLVIAGLVLLGAGLVALWQKSETFRNIVMGAWEGIKIGAAAVVGWFTGTALPALQAMWDSVVAAVRFMAGLVVGGITGMVNGVVGLVTWWRDTTVAIGQALANGVVAVVTWLSNAAVAGVRGLANGAVAVFTWWRDTSTAVVTTGSTWIVDKLAGMATWGIQKVTDLKNGALRVFEDWKAGAIDLATRLAEGVGAGIEKIRELAAKPVRFVIETVMNGLAKGYNFVAGLFGLTKMNEDMKAGFVGGGPVAPRGYTGAGGRYDSAGVGLVEYHRGEYVWTAPEVRQAGGPGGMERLKADVLGGFAGGGYVFPVPGFRVTGGAHSSNGSAPGVDIAAPTGTPVVAARDAVVADTPRLGYSYGWHIKANSDGGRQVYAHLSDILVSVGQRIAAGQLIGRVGSTGRSTGPHLHFEDTAGATFSVGQGDAAGSAGGGGFDVLGKIRDAVAGPLGKLKELGDNPFVKAVAAAPRKIADGMIDKVKGLASSLFSGSDGGFPSVAAKGSVLEQIMQISKAWGIPRRAAHIALITAMQEASGQLDFTPDENSDVGPFQQRTPRDGTIAELNDVSNALRIFYRGTWARPGNGDGGGYHVPGLFDKNWTAMGLGQAAQAVQQSRYPSYYDKHVPRAEQMLNAFGYDSGGWLPPGITSVVNASGKPEPVLTHDQWERLLTALEGLADGGGGGDVVVMLDGYPVRRIARDELQRQTRRKVDA